jgi:hypothetical protein
LRRLTPVWCGCAQGGTPSLPLPSHTRGRSEGRDRSRAGLNGRSWALPLVPHSERISGGRVKERPEGSHSGTPVSLVRNVAAAGTWSPQAHPRFEGSVGDRRVARCSRRLRRGGTMWTGGTYEGGVRASVFASWRGLSSLRRDVVNRGWAARGLAAPQATSPRFLDLTGELLFVG